MKLEWDSAKNTRNIEERGLNFEDVSLVFSGPTLTFTDTRFDYGETRQVTFGLLAHRMVVIAHTQRGQFTRIISMRKGNEREQKAYQERLEAIRRNV